MSIFSVQHLGFLFNYYCWGCGKFFPQSGFSTCQSFLIKTSSSKISFLLLQNFFVDSKLWSYRENDPHCCKLFFLLDFLFLHCYKIFQLFREFNRNLYFTFYAKVFFITLAWLAKYFYLFCFRWIQTLYYFDRCTELRAFDQIGRNWRQLYFDCWDHGCKVCHQGLFMKLQFCKFNCLNFCLVSLC